MTDKPSIEDQIIQRYAAIIEAAHPSRVSIWPVLSGYNAKTARYKGWVIVIFEHTGGSGFQMLSGLGELSEDFVGVDQITQENRERVRARLERHYFLKQQDAVFFVDPTGNPLNELELMKRRHENALGLSPMKIFLSHKGADKPLVREFRATLSLLGFAPWLDEDAMPAGTGLERGIKKGFDDSCAAVFFITPNFADQSYLATEVDYAIAEKRKKGERFSIITLVVRDNGQPISVPPLLEPFVWKEPKGQLEALNEILRALPIHLGSPYWRPGVA